MAKAEKPIGASCIGCAKRSRSHLKDREIQTLLVEENQGRTAGEGGRWEKDAGVSGCKGLVGGGRAGTDDNL